MDHGDQVRWLDDHEQQVWRDCMAVAQRLASSVATDLAAGEPSLSMGEYELLVRLSESPDGRARMAALARDLVHSRSRLTHTTTRLESRGLVERRACESDGRGVLAVLTDAGRRALAAAAPAHVESVRSHLFDVLDAAQVAALGGIMATLAEHGSGRRAAELATASSGGEPPHPLAPTG